MKVYLFLYNPCIHESAPATISIHQTKVGAFNAMRAHKRKAYDEWINIRRSSHRKRYKFGRMEDWFTSSVELLP